VHFHYGIRKCTLGLLEIKPSYSIVGTSSAISAIGLSNELNGIIDC